MVHTHRHTLTHRGFYTQKLSHTEAFTDRSFRTQKLSHTNTFTHRDRTHDIAILPQFLAIEPHFVRKGCARTREIAILLQFLAIEPHFVRKGRSNLISCESIAFRGVSLALPRVFKREIEKKEGARGQESKRAREQERI